MKTYPNVSIVVIGHNEGHNLDECFNAIHNMDYPQEKIEIIYVDSNSTDESVSIAKKYTKNLFFVGSIWPTAGEAFNKGIKESKHDYIHISAGDIFLSKDYLKHAIEILSNDENIQAVTGYFVEKKNSGINKIIGFRREEDDFRVGQFVSSPNGGTFKKEALIKVNGYDERIKKGQETELGIRFKQQRFKIWHMPILQGIHDFELRNIFDLIAKNHVNGFSIGHLLYLSYKEKTNGLFKQRRKTAYKIISVNFALLLGIFLSLSDLYQGFLLVSLYFCYYPIKNLFKFNTSVKYKYYSIVMGYFSFFTFIGIINFYIFLINQKIKGNTVYHIKKGLTK